MERGSVLCHPLHRHVLWAQLLILKMSSLEAILPLQTPCLCPCSPTQWSFNMAPVLTFLLPLFLPAPRPSSSSHLQVQIFTRSEIPSCFSSASHPSPSSPTLAGHQEKKEWGLALCQGLPLAAECSNTPYGWKSRRDPRGNIAS